MKIDFSKFSILCCITILSFFSSFAQSLPGSIPLRVVIIRHGEKPDSGFNLSCKGYNRSLALPGVFAALFGVPAYIFVPIIRTGKSTNSVRMYQTVIPFAVRYGLVINSWHAETDTAGIAAALKKKKGTVLVVWDSKNIPPIARNLGIKNKGLKWDPDDFDSIWIINFVKSRRGGLRPELTVTKEGIYPSSECN
jgi:hypothetical protein